MGIVSHDRSLGNSLGRSPGAFSPASGPSFVIAAHDFLSPKAPAGNPYHH
jgi:hypothetical protein